MPSAREDPHFLHFPTALTGGDVHIIFLLIKGSGHSFHLPGRQRRHVDGCCVCVDHPAIDIGKVTRFRAQRRVVS